MAGFLHDSFTLKLLQVQAELVKKGAFPRKGTFANGVGTINSTYNKIERHEMNLPAHNQATAKKYLYEHFGVNRAWWNKPTNVEVEFDWEPAQTRLSQKGKISIPIKDYTYYQQLEQELAECKEQVEQYKNLGIAAEPRIPYNPDANPDKTKKK